MKRRHTLKVMKNVMLWTICQGLSLFGDSELVKHAT